MERDGVSRRAVIVLGMHRSGTSALAGVLESMGATAPSNLIPGDGENERGYHESPVLVDLNDRLFAALSSDWTDWTALEPNLAPSWLSADLESTLRQEFGSADLFVIKDPRLCRLLPLWLPVLKQMSIDARVVIPLRRPEEVVNSLLARERFWLSCTDAALLWLRHVLDAERCTRGMPRVLIRYEDLLCDWRGQVGRIGDDLRIQWPRSIEEGAPEIEAFLSASLRHHSSPTAPDLDVQISEWLARASSALQQLVIDERDSLAMSELDAVQQAFNEAISALPAFIREAQAQVRDELARRAQELSRLRRDNEGLAHAIHASRRELESVQGHLETERMRASELEDQLRDGEVEMGRLRQGISVLRARVQHLARVERAQADALDERSREIAYLGSVLHKQQNVGQVQRQNGWFALAAVRRGVVRTSDLREKLSLKKRIAPAPPPGTPGVSRDGGPVPMSATSEAERGGSSASGRS